MQSTSNTLQKFKLHAKSPDGYSIECLADWERFSPPKEKNQWQDFRSAKEFARVWFRNGSLSMPAEYQHLLDANSKTVGFHPQQAFAEAEISLDEFGGPRNSDAVLIGETQTQNVLLAIEAKADESFAKPISKELVGLSENSNKPERIDRLCKAVFGRQYSSEFASVRYQLLHSLAATAIAAKQHQCGLGILLIHEFISLSLDFAKVTSNAVDLQHFIQLVPGWETQAQSVGKMITPVTLHGNDRIPNDQPVTIAKVRTLLPLDLPRQDRPAPGYCARSHQFLDCQ